MKLKITIGKLNRVDKFTPLKQASFSAASPLEAMEAFKNFFLDNTEVALPQDVELILQSGDPLTIAAILSIKHFLYEAGLGLEYYAYDEADESILDNISIVSGMLLLDEAQQFYGFIPRGYFLRFASESDADPIKIYTWVNNTVRLFPSVSSDPYTKTLDEVKELATLVGGMSTPVMNRLMKILHSFKKRLVLI